MVSRRTLLGATTAGAAGVLLGSPAAAAAPIGGRIERSEVIRRARLWVDQRVPYSQNQQDAFGDGDGHRYRPDCSGYVSMGWHLPRKPNGWDRNTADFRTWSGRTWLTGYDDLRKGDALLAANHVVIFDKWADATRTAVKVFQEPTYGRFAEYVTRTVAQYRDSGFRAMRYDGIAEDGAGESPDPHGELWVRSRGAAGLWGPSSRLDPNSRISTVAAAGLPDGTLHVFTVVPGAGVFHRMRGAAGTWAAQAVLIDPSPAVRAIAATSLPNGTLHLFSVVPGAAGRAGGVWHRQRTAVGLWARDATRVDGNGEISRVAASGLPNGEIHLQTLVPMAGVWTRVRNAAGGWNASSSSLDDNDYIIDIASAATTKGEIVFAAVVPESGVWTRVRKPTGVWDELPARIDTNGNIDAVSAAALPDGSTHVQTIVNGHGVWTRERAASGGWRSSATRVDTNPKIFAMYSAGQPNGTLQVGSLADSAWS